MAAYARIYGFTTFGKNEIKGHEDDFTSVSDNRYVTNSDFEMLEEIINKEF